MDPKVYEKSDYRTFWVGKGKIYLDKLEKAIIRRSLPGGGSIAEIGAGYGRLTGSYIDKYRQVHLVEPAQNLRKIAAETYGSAAIYHEADVYRLPFLDASLDALVMVRLLHHLDEPKKALTEITRTLKPGGTLVFNYSNKINPSKVAAFLLKKRGHPFSLEPERYAQSLFGHHPRWIRQTLILLGFEIKKEYGVGILDKLLAFAPPLASLLPPLLWPARWAGQTHLSPAIFIVAVKK